MNMKNKNVAKNNDKALQEFMARIAEAKTLLDELQTFADDHMEYSPDDINWGHVGSAGYMVERLNELADWAFERGEHAE